MNAKGYVGWKLDEKQRAALLAQFPPAFPKVIAHHITRLPFATRHFVPHQTEGRIIGYSSDPQMGIEAFVVTIDDSYVRPDGEVYHITWSLDPEKGAKAMDSNKLIRDRAWMTFINPIPIHIHPDIFV